MWRLCFIFCVIIKESEGSRADVVTGSLPANLAKKKTQNKTELELFELAGVKRKVGGLFE